MPLHFAYVVAPQLDYREKENDRAQGKMPVAQRAAVSVAKEEGKGYQRRTEARFQNLSPFTRRLLPLLR